MQWLQVIYPPNYLPELATFTVSLPVLSPFPLARVSQNALDFVANAEAQNSRAKKLHYKNGAVYTGKKKTLSWVGEAENNKRHGKGTMVWADGAKYDGSWKNDMAHGYGKFKYANGDIYEGSPIG